MCLKFVIFPILWTSFVRTEQFLTTNNCDRGIRINDAIAADCKCPPNFALLSSEVLCVMLTTKRVWSGEFCTSSGTVDDFYSLSDTEKVAVRKLINLKGAGEVWISVKNDGRFGSERSMLPGRSWGIVPNLTDLGILDYNGTCLKVNGNSTKGTFEDCNKLHPQLCIYRPKKTMLRLYCEDPEELTSRYSYYQDTCIKIESNNSNRTKLTQLEIDSDRKLELYFRLIEQTSHRCDYTNLLFSPTYDAPKSFRSIQNVMHKNYSSLANTSTCIAYQRRISTIVKPQLNLKFDRVLQKLVLSITNARFLWREDVWDLGFTCFAGTTLELRQVVAIEHKLWPTQNVTAIHDAEIYELEMLKDLPYQYWCEGHAVPNFTLVQSQTVVAQRKDSDVHVFAVQIQVLMDGLQIPHGLELEYAEYLNLFDQAGMIKMIQTMSVIKIETQQSRNMSVTMHFALKQNSSTHYTSRPTKLNNIPPELLSGIEDHYRLKLLFEDWLKWKHSSIFVGINSTEMCFPEEFDSNESWWPMAPIGQSVTLHTKDLCLLKSGLPPFRKCLGDRIYGGVWETVEKDSLKCDAKPSNESNVLNAFYKNSTHTQIDAIEGALEGINSVIRNSTADVVPADIFHVSGAVDNFRKTLLNNGTNNAPTTKTTTTVIGNKSTSYCCGLAEILSGVMDVKESVVREAQSKLNATSVLLDSTEDLINQLSVASGSTESLRFGGDLKCPNDRRGETSARPGTMLLRKPMFVLLVADPQEANITGMALIRSEQTVDDDFNSYDLRLLTMDQSENDTLAIKNLEIATFIPRTLVVKMKQLRAQVRNITQEDIPFRVVISVYFNDHMFLETLSTVNNRRANGKIISITVPGYGSELPEQLPIFIRDREPTQNCSCQFWKIVRGDGDERCRWSSSGCEWAQKLDNVNLCKCSHMTSFSRIFQTPQRAQAMHEDHPMSTLILDTITLVGCILSLLGVAGIFITAMIIPSWSNVFNSKILLQLSFAVAIQLIVFLYVGHTKSPDPDVWCIAQGASLHYIILVTFMWMLAIAYLQFMQFVKVLGKLRPSHCILKASILSWGLPLAPIGFFVYKHPTLYYPISEHNSAICYPSGDAQFFGLIIPIAVILTINVASFLLIIYNVSKVPDNLTRSTDKSMALLQLRLFVLLFFQLGLSWIFGMMIIDNKHIVWSYLFCLTAPFQGLMLFVNFILLQPSTRRLWSKKLSDMISENSDKLSIKKSTSSLQNSQPPLWL